MVLVAGKELVPGLVRYVLSPMSPAAQVPGVGGHQPHSAVAGCRRLWRLGAAGRADPSLGRGPCRDKVRAVRAGSSFQVFRPLPENDCSPGFKAV